MLAVIKNRPPLVVFFLCLFTLAITIFCFAFYIKNTDPVPDSDKNHDWLMLLKHFNSLDTCLQLNQSSKKVQSNNFIEMTTIQTLISINNSDLLKKFTTVKGFLTLENWHSNCQKTYYEKPSQLQVSFDVPEVAMTNITKFDVCVTITGPEEYLPKFSEPNCVTSTRKEKKKPEIYLSTSVRGKYNEVCKNGLLTKLIFYPQDKRKFANFLSDNEKSLIYVHLLWTSYFLVFILLIIVTYGILQSEHVFDKYIQKFTTRN